MSQQVNYVSAETAPLDAKTLRATRWGLFLGVLCGLVPVAFIALTILVEIFGQFHWLTLSLSYQFEIFFWTTALLMLPAMLLLTRTPRPRTIWIFLEMMCVRALFFFLLLDHSAIWFSMYHILRGYAEWAGITWRHDFDLFVAFILWNLLAWGIVHLASRNLRMLRAARSSRALQIILIGGIGLSTLISALFFISDVLRWHPFLSFGDYAPLIGVISIITLFGSYLALLVIGAVAFVSLCRIKK